MVKPLKTKVPELLISQAVPVMVIVLPVSGDRFLPPLTVKVPAIEKLEVG